MEITPELIKKINKECPYGQGIFKEPYGIPVSVKGLVVYTRYGTGGYSGGSCWDDSDPQPYYESEPKEKFKVLDLLLEEIFPKISYMQYKKIESIVRTNEETEWEYYGNSTDWKIEFIELDKLLKLLDDLC